MNLIEQLGGYEAAKSKCDRANKEGYLLLSVPVQNGFGDIYVHKVEAALLEYRRQHNIFEVGDLSLTIDPWFGSNLLTVVDFRKSETERYAIFSDGGFFRISGLRHATDAEIEAGKRLGVV
ncbi:hypothetical protein [Acinetobacter radioresistens]|uniref:hypothetical protein n=1 Tax=Acinetobacter radioresistens TaxID=40216 RepID=UPI000C332C2D|nr:hypothetical protein [Acinetobacter radioresistens]PKH28735.1 hypothetical protein BJF94_12315 [Acinetobacter radioresistens]